MTLEEFSELIRKNIDVFEKNYKDQRLIHPNPDDAYPLTLTPEMWFVQLDVWFRMLEALGGLKPQPIYQENELEDGAVEFRLDGWDDE